MSVAIVAPSIMYFDYSLHKIKGLLAAFACKLTCPVFDSVRTVVPAFNGPSDEGTPGERGQRTGYFGFLSLLRRTVIIICVIFFLIYFISKMATDKQHSV